MDTTIIVQLIILVGVIYSVWMQHHQTPAQKDKDVIANYSALLNEYRVKDAEQQKEVDRLEKEKREDEEAHMISIKNFEAVMQKRQMEYDQELVRIRKELQAYQIGYAALRRVAVKYVPADVVLPEVNGNTKDLK